MVDFLHEDHAGPCSLLEPVLRWLPTPANTSYSHHLSDRIDQLRFKTELQDVSHGSHM